ncbi:MAG: hypothetical protein HRU13_01260 [Phycisphaerales bacterium]|nr:hypothetical protein [Phycisphaerales bacterium]
MRRIRYPYELRAVIRGIRNAIELGLLEEIADPVRGRWAEVEYQPSFAEIERGPWPDFVHLEFRDPGTGKRYVLSVETYHGSGGTWEEVPD